MPQVREYLKKLTGHIPLGQVNPDEAVALGAAIQVHLPMPQYTVLSIKGEQEPEEKGGLFHIRRKTREAGKASPAGSAQNVGQEQKIGNVLSMNTSEITAHAMGVIAVDAAGENYINKTIIRSGEPIPSKCAESFRFYTAPGQDNELEIYMLQGMRQKPLENEIVGKYVATGIRHDRAHNPTLIRIQYSYDINALVHVQVRQENSDHDLSVREEPVPSDMSEFGRPIDKTMVKTASEPLSILLIADVSGSMNGEPLREAKKAMKEFVTRFEQYPGDVRIGIGVVSDASQIIQAPTDNFARCMRSIDSIRECQTGICNAADPFMDVDKHLGRARGKRIAVVLADGVWDHQSAAIQRAKDCHRKEINIIGIGFGTADKAFLKAISYGDIDAMKIEQNELVQGFGKIAQEIGAGEQRRSGRDGSGSEQTATWLAIGE